MPGGIFSDLEDAKLIQQNLLGFNDVNNRWVGNESVIYKTEIQRKIFCYNVHCFIFYQNLVIPVNEELSSAPYVILSFHGLDTFTTIYVNDVEVGKSSNMYLRYNFDIKPHLKVKHIEATWISILDDFSMTSN